MPEHSQNQATFRRLRSQIEASYPKGRFVAIASDRIVADAASFEELERVLRAMGRERGESLVVEVGAELPEYVNIFF
jgi:hypothetical protein